MRKILFTILAACTLVACSDDEDLNAYDSYNNWQARNEEWFAELAAQARADKENWAMYCTTSLQQGSTLADSVIVHYIVRQEGEAPCYNDTIGINYRGWLMPTLYRIDGKDTTYCAVFDQSFYGIYGADEVAPFDNGTASPTKACLNKYITGFATALQHMHVGEQAHIYIPYQLGYGDRPNNTIPAYSTLHFFVNLTDIRKAGEQ